MSSAISALRAKGLLAYSPIQIKKDLVHDFVYYDRRFDDLSNEWSMLDQSFMYEHETDALEEYLDHLQKLMDYYLNQVLTQCVSTDEHDDSVSLTEIDHADTYEYLCHIFSDLEDDNFYEEEEESNIPPPPQPVEPIEYNAPENWDDADVNKW